MEIRETPWLTPESIAFLEQLINSNPNLKILEFGCGGSTIWFSRKLNFPGARLVTVEHDAQWHQAIKSRITPSAELRLESRPYARVCDEFPDEYFDLVLVDGRDRILCAGKSMRLVKPGGYMMLDNADRREYAAIEEVLLKNWPMRRTAVYEGPEASENGGWFTDMWKKPLEKDEANVADDTLVDHGESYAHKGDFESAQQFGRLSIEKDCRVAEAFNLLAVACCSTNEVRNAIGLLKAGYALEPNNPNICKNLALLYTNLGQREDALQIYNNLLTIDPTDKDVHEALKNMGEVGHAVQAESSANGHKRAIVKGDVTDPQRALNNARALFAGGRHLEAFDLYEQILEAYPQHSIQILSEASDCYSSMPDQNSRYDLYQARLFDFDIKPTDKVLDIGSGNVPFPFATHLADLAIEDDSYGRNGVPFKHLDGKPVYECNIERMPFADNEFDFVYCSHVLEHVANPEAACRELMRIAKRGYIETPTKSKDLMLNTARVSNHRWGIELFNDTLVFTEYTKREIDGLCCDVMIAMHLNPGTQREKAITPLIYLKADLFNTMLMWDGSFKCEVRRLEDRSLAPDAPVIKSETIAPVAIATPPMPQQPQPTHVFEQKEQATTDWLREMTLKINKAVGDAAQLVAIAGELAEHGHDDTAEELARMVISRNPQYADAYNLLGVVYANRGSNQDALRYFENARRLDKRNTDIGKNLIAVYMQLAEFEKAIESCQEMLQSNPEDPELPQIIGDLLETVSSEALKGLEVVETAENSIKMVEGGAAAARMLRIYSDPKYLPKGRNHDAVLSAFWGANPEDKVDGGRFNRFIETASEFFSMTSLEEADIAVLPGHWTPGGHKSATQLAKKASKAGKPILIFFNDDSDEEINIDNAITFRTSFYRSKRKPTEFALPAFSVDFTECYLDGRVPLRRKTSKPKVSFCGCMETDPTGSRERALKLLEVSPLVDTDFIIRPACWGTLDDDSIRETTRDEYVHNMVDSDYVLCTRGTGNFSYRLYEALSCGRIPVFIDTDAVLPFDDIIDWQQYCIWVDQSDVDQIAEKVAEFHDSMSADEFYDMQFACRKLWEQWLSPGGFYSNIWRYIPDNNDRVQSPGKPTSSAIDSPKSVTGKQPTAASHTGRSCLFINTCYPQFLNDHYTKNPALMNASYDEQMESLRSTFFGDADFYSSGMKQAGWDAEDMVINCNPLQIAWARENGFAGGGLDIAIEQIRRKQPDVVYLQNLGLAKPEILAAIRPHTKLIVGQIASPVPDQADVKGLDIIFSSFPHFVERFRAMGITSYYQPLAFDPRVLDSATADRKQLGATFVGGISRDHGKGTEFLEQVAAAVPMDVWGYGADTLSPDSPLRRSHRGEAWGLDMFSLLRQSQVTINRHIDVAENNANNMRLFEATGCGAMLITDYKDNLNELFEIGKEVVAYRSPEECATLTKYYLDHPEEAEQIAKAGQARTLRDHTYAKRMEQTAEILGRHLRYQDEASRHCLVDTQTVSVGHTAIAKSDITESMTTAWQSEDIPAQQRALVHEQLIEMYNGKVNPLFQVLANILQPHTYPGCPILEIGCASGYYYEIMEYMLGKQINYTGVDYSEPLIKMARDYYPNADFHVADGAKLPFTDKQFDVAISSCVLLHVPNYADHIKETARVAGNYVVAHRTPICRTRPTQYLKKLAYGVETVELRFNEDELLSLFAANGLELIKSVQYYANPSDDAYEASYLFKKI